MKMRFWQKTYVFTLVLFLICLNVGVLSLTVYTNSKNVTAAEEAAKAEQYYIAMSFERDFGDLKDAGRFTNISLLMKSYGVYYSGKGLKLAFEEDNDIIYSALPEEYVIEKNSLLHTDIDGKRHIVISSEICDENYVMVYAKNVESLDKEFNSLMLTYVSTAAAVSLILAVCLYFILKKLSSPLEALRRTTETVEAGDFSVTAEEKGSDEFTLLSKSFNSMLRKINEQMAALEDEAKKKQLLVDNMAHELRTPLTSIQGYAEYIEKGNISDEQRLIAAKYVISEADRLKKISEILLDGAFIRENEIQMEETDLGKIASDVCDKLRLRAEKSDIRIETDISPVTVRGNETLLSMLIYNLTENAIKASFVGGTVKVICRSGSLTVEDTGKGMTEKQLSHITEPFYRTDRSRSRAEGGAGLGLALCKQIVSTHKAELIFESEIGKGTRASVIFTS